MFQKPQRTHYENTQSETHDEIDGIFITPINVLAQGVAVHSVFSDRTGDGIIWKRFVNSMQRIGFGKRGCKYYAKGILEAHYLIEVRIFKSRRSHHRTSQTSRNYRGGVRACLIYFCISKSSDELLREMFV